MNLRGIANQYTQVINPNISITWLKSNGYTTNAAGSRVPVQISTVIQAQVQGITGGDLKHIDALTLQGVFRSVHMFGNPQGVVKVDAQGGDILQFPEVPNGPIRNWKVIHVAETWDTWGRVIVAIQ